MIAVFKREFSSAFHRLYAYITVGVTALVSAILLMNYNLMYTSENTVSVVSAMAIVVALIIPVTAVCAFPSRKRSDTDMVLDMMPVTSRDIVLGKYLAALAQLMIPTAIMLLYPIFSGFFGTVDNKLSYVTLLAYILFEAALLAVCMLIAYTAKSRVRAFISCYAVIVVWYFADIVNVLIPTLPVASLIGFAVVALLLGAALYAVTKKLALAICVTAVMGVALAVSYMITPESFVGLLERFIDNLSIFHHFNSFCYGLFSIKGLLFFALIIFVFLFLIYRKHEQGYESVRCAFTLRITKVTSVMLAVVTVAASLAVNVAAGVLPNRFTSFDATGYGKYSVSAEAKQFLSTVDEDVTVYLLESTGDEAYELYLEKLAACNEHITLERVFYSSTPEFYTETGLAPTSVTANSLVIASEKRLNYLSYPDMLVYSNASLGATEMTYSQYQYYYSMFSSNESYSDYLYSLVYDTVVYFDGDAKICSYVEYAVKDIIPDSYYLTGHGENDASSSASAFYGYVTALDITDGTQVPADAACVLINMPTEDISESECAELLAYLERGGQLTVLTNEANLDMPNLMSLLAAYGMRAEKGTVTDVISDEDNDEDTPTTDITAVINTDNDVLCYLEDSGVQIVVSDANAITLDGSAKDTLVHFPLLSSTETSYIGDNSDSTSSHIIACAAETADGARIAWFTGGESFNDAGSNESYAAMLAMSWVTLEYQSELGNVPATVYAQSITAVDSGAARLIAMTLIILPIAFMVVGGIAYYRRRVRR